MGFPQQPVQNQAPLAPQVDPEMLQKGHQHLDAIMDGLISLVSKPKGELTKKDVFDTSSDMIAKGAFPTPESKQKLIGELANLPDDEEGIRQVLGQHLLQTAATKNHFNTLTGPQ